MAAAASYSCPLSCAWSAAASALRCSACSPAWLPEQLVRLGGALRLASPEWFVYGLFLVVLDMPLAALAGISHDVRSASGSPHPIP